MTSMTKEERKAENAKLYAAMREAGRAGDRDAQLVARDAFIEANLGLVPYCVEKVLGTKRANSRHRGDVWGACRLALVEAADKLLTTDAKNPIAYATSAMRRAGARVLIEAPIVPVDQGANKRRRAGGLKDNELLKPGKTCKLYDRHIDPQNGKAILSDELWEELMACCASETENKVIVGLAEEKPTTEIASELGVTVRTVQRAREQVRERFEARNDIKLATKSMEDYHALAA